MEKQFGKGFFEIEIKIACTISEIFPSLRDMSQFLLQWRNS